MAASVIGAVVVGVGRAGGARIRDLQEASNVFELKGFVSRRELEFPGIPQLKFEDALASPDVTAIIICTESETHADLIRQSLDSGKHVLVEYPVTMSSSAARDLFALAGKKGVVLHEENIGLLLESHQKLKEMAKTKKLKTGTVNLAGRFNGWVEKPGLEGRPLLCVMGELQTVYDVFGDLTAVKTTWDSSDNGFKFCAEFTPKDGNEKLYVKGEYQKESAQRIRTIYVEFEDGEVFDSSAFKPSVPPGTKPGLFMRDANNFAAKIRGEMTVDADNLRSVRCLEIAEEAHELLK